MKFKKGEIVPYEIVERKEKYYNMVVFGCDVEVINNTVYPVNTMRKTESIITVRKGVKEGIKCNYNIFTLPKENK